MISNSSTIGIYSVGLLGGSVGLALKASGFSGTIIGLSSKQNIDTALQIGCIDKGYSYNDLDEIVSQIDVLFLCSPISVIMKTLDRLSHCKLPNGLLITDIGSTKKEIMTAALALPQHVNFIGGHPMAGSEKSGASASDPYLFQNAVYILYPDANTPSELLDSFSDFIKQHLGSQPIVLDPLIHDTIVATVSHIPHLLAVSLVNQAHTMDEQIQGTFILASGGFRDMTRIASTSFPMWKDIFQTNTNAIDLQLDSLIDSLHDIKQRLKDNSLKELFDKAKETRSHIASGNKGFVSQLNEVLVIAPDQVGVIAKIATILAQHKINIKDIEVLKVRENECGTIRIAFDSSVTARSAITILNDNGFSARERT